MVRANDLDRQPGRIVYRNRGLWWTSVLAGSAFAVLGLAMVVALAGRPTGPPWWVDGLVLLASLLIATWFLLGLRLHFEVDDGVIHFVNKFYRYDIPLEDVASVDVGPFTWRGIENHRMAAIRVHRRDGTVISSASGCRDPRIVRQLDEMRRGVWPYEQGDSRAPSL